MAPPDRKRVERADLLWFQLRCPDIAKLRFEDGNEPPDFVSGGLAIEHTTLRAGAKSRGGARGLAWEVTRDKVMDMAEKTFQEQSDANVIVQPQFRDRDIPKTSWRPLADAIAQMVLEHLPANGGSVFLADNSLLGPAEQYLMSLGIVRQDPKRLWDGRAQGGPWKPKDIQNSIDRKERDLPEYRANYDSVWLLVVAPGFHAGGYSHTSSLAFIEFVEQMTWTFAFDRVYVADRIRERVVRLRMAGD